MKGEGKDRAYLARFVLCDFVLGVLLAVLAFAVGAAGFRYVDLYYEHVVLAICKLRSILKSM